jgi:hypothetical protein
MSVELIKEPKQLVDIFCDYAVAHGIIRFGEPVNGTMRSGQLIRGGWLLYIESASTVYRYTLPLGYACHVVAGTEVKPNDKLISKPAYIIDHTVRPDVRF